MKSVDLELDHRGWSTSLPLLLFLSSVSSAAEPPVPVHRLPYSCNRHGFPIVMQNGILGCFKDGSTGLWLDDATNQTHALPAGDWTSGEVLYRIGQTSGLWDLQSQSWAEPARRIVGTVDADMVFASAENILWADEKKVYRLNVLSGEVLSKSAKALQGTHPIAYGADVAWVQWGDEMGIHVWSPSKNSKIWMPSPHPTSLITHDDALVWVSQGQILSWVHGEVKVVISNAGIQEVFSTQSRLCWTRWNQDLDIFCTGGFHLQRAGHQSNPMWKGDSLYFTEGDRLWVYKPNLEQSQSME